MLGPRLYVLLKIEHLTHFFSVTYRAMNFSDNDVWTARSYYIANKFDQAVKIIYKANENELKNIKEPKALAEKIAPYISSTSGSITIVEKILPAVEMFMKAF